MGGGRWATVPTTVSIATNDLGAQWEAGHGVSIAMANARAVLDVPVVCIQVCEPAGQHIIRITEAGQPDKGGMISPDGEFPTIHVLTELLDKCHYRNQLTQGGTIAALCFMENFGSISLPLSPGRQPPERARLPLHCHWHPCQVCMGWGNARTGAVVKSRLRRSKFCWHSSVHLKGTPLPTS